MSQSKNVLNSYVFFSLKFFLKCQLNERNSPPHFFLQIVVTQFKRTTV